MSQADVLMADDSPHKRKRTLDDVGDRDQKKLHLDDFGVGIGELHIDVGEKYLLCGLCKDTHFLLSRNFKRTMRNALVNSLLTVLLTF